MATISFSGLASGIDSTALIEATSEATRKTRVTPSRDKVTDLTETNSAFEELTTKLESVRTTLSSFTTLNGGGVSKSATSSRESVATATASNAASNGTYSLTVNQLAKNHTLSFATSYASTTTALQSGLTGAEPAADRTITVTTGTGSNLETVNIVVTDGSYTISDFVNAFNNASTKSEASLVNVGTTPADYRIVISSINEGTDLGLIATSLSGTTALTNLQAPIEDAATNAEFRIDGIVSAPAWITRSTNSIADVIPGLTLSLGSTGTSTVKVAEDAATTTSKVQEFIDAYNDVVAYIAKNNLVTREEDGQDIKNTFSPLANTRTDDNALTALRSAISGATATGGSAVRIFADLGITTQRDGTLAFDTTKFKTAVSTEPSSVSSVLTSFADTTATTGGTIDVYTRFNGLIDISVNSNKTLIADLNKRIADAEAQIAKTEEQMKARFARLEAQIGKLQQQQSSLSSALAGLSR